MDTTAPSRNLAPQRGPSVWDKKSLRPSTDVYAPQRWAVGVTGGTVAAFGLSKRSWTGAVMAVVGGGLALRAVTGHNDIDTLRACLERAWAGRSWLPGDIVEDASDASFPASDPPSFTRNRVKATTRH